MAPIHVVRRAHIMTALALSTLAGCKGEQLTAKPIRGAISADSVSPARTREYLSQTERSTVSFTAAIRNATDRAVRDSDRVFGKRQDRSRESVCRDVASLLRREITLTDSIIARGRSDAQREALLSAALQASGCETKQKALSIFASPEPYVPPMRPQVDAATAYVEANLRYDVLSSAASSYGSAVERYGRVSHEAFHGGMTDMEIAVFDRFASELDANVEYLAPAPCTAQGSCVRNPMSIFMQGTSLRSAVIAGCVGGMLKGYSSIISGAQAGFALAGPWGAAGAAAAVAAEHCVAGGAVAYVLWRMTK